MALSKPSIPGTAQHFLECGIEDCERNCEFYCNPCHQQLCKQCKDEHLRSPETKNHEVVLYQVRKRQLPVKKCKIHPTKDIDLLCNECKVALCSKCTTTEDHGGHRFSDLETLYAEKFALGQEKISKVQEYFLPTSQDLQKEIKEDVTEIKKIMANLRTAVKADAESLKSMVDTVASENMEKLNKIEQSLLEKLQNQSKTFDDYIAYLNDLVREFHGYLSSPDLLNLITKLSEKNLNIQPIPETKKLRTPVISTGQYSKEDVAKLLGKINDVNLEEEMRKIKSMKITSSLVSMKFTNEQSKPGRHKKSDMKQTLSLSSSVSEVREFEVAGVKNARHISLDQSGRLWVSDWSGNLVQTDLQGNQLQKITTSRGYGYHTVLQDGELIFTDSDKKVINKITLDNNITEIIKTGDWVPISIHSSHINGDLLVGMKREREAKVTRYDRTGKELQNIQRDNKGKALYSDPQYITENINGDICTSDYTKTVMVVNKSGQHRFSYTGQGSEFNPYGICTDVLGHVLVCDGLSVHLLDQNGQFLSLLLTSSQVFILISVCVDDENNLYVGQLGTTVKVYKYLQ